MARSFHFLPRGGEFLRMTEADWTDACDTSRGRKRGGRWNRPGSFPVLYLFRTVDGARQLFDSRFSGDYVLAETIRRPPVLWTVDVTEASFVDIVTNEGCVAAGLERDYPEGLRTDSGHPTCWPIGDDAWAQGTAGIACRSATSFSDPIEEEMAWFDRGDSAARCRPNSTPFADWYLTGSTGRSSP